MLSKTIVYYPKSITLSAKRYIYDGKVKKPSVTVKGSNGKKIKPSNYSISYLGGCKNVGKYTVKIVFKGNYSGTMTTDFTIQEKGDSISKTKSRKGSYSYQMLQTDGVDNRISNLMF